MGKKSNKGATSSSAANAAYILGALILMSGIIWFTLRSSTPTPTPNAPLVPEETTLDPSLFTGVVRTAYEAAKEIPQVLAQLPCYCGCIDFGHKSNLDCFHDRHGEECTMCRDIALDARQMYKNGMSVDQIRENIKDKYSKFAALQ